VRMEAWRSGSLRGTRLGGQCWDLTRSGLLMQGPPSLLCADVRGRPVGSRAEPAHGVSPRSRVAARVLGSVKGRLRRNLNGSAPLTLPPRAGTWATGRKRPLLCEQESRSVWPPRTRSKRAAHDTQRTCTRWPSVSGPFSRTEPGTRWPRCTAPSDPSGCTASPAVVAARSHRTLTTCSKQFTATVRAVAGKPRGREALQLDVSSDTTHQKHSNLTSVPG
jgi:hypothetical protein